MDKKLMEDVIFIILGYVFFLKFLITPYIIISVKIDNDFKQILFVDIKRSYNFIYSLLILFVFIQVLNCYNTKDINLFILLLVSSFFISLFAFIYKYAAFKFFIETVADGALKEKISVLIQTYCLVYFVISCACFYMCLL